MFDLRPCPVLGQGAKGSGAASDAAVDDSPTTQTADQLAMEADADARESMPCAAALLGQTTPSKKPKAKPKLKKVIASTGAARNDQEKSVTRFVDAAQTLRESILGEVSLDGFKKYEAQLRDMTTASKGKSELAMELDMEEEYLSCRELADFMTHGREFLRAWKAYAHSATERNRTKFNAAWTPFEAMVGDDSDLRLAAANDLIKGEIMLATQNAITGSCSWGDVGKLCTSQNLTGQYGLTKQKHLLEVQKNSGHASFEGGIAVTTHG